MNVVVALLVDFAIGYLIGSIPTSYIAGRARGVNLLEEGSGNLGATNVFRVLGWRTAVPVLVVDIAKGALPVILGLRGLLPAGPTSDSAALAAGIGAIVGHSYSPWVRFRGGKGVATAAGAFLTLAPWGMIPAMAVWLLLLLSTRIMSIASIAAAAVLPVALIIRELSDEGPHQWATLVASFVMGAFVLLRHRENLQRLREGEERPLWG